MWDLSGLVVVGTWRRVYWFSFLFLGPSTWPEVASERRLYLDSHFSGKGPINGEGRAVGAAWFMVVLIWEQRKGNAGAQLDFYFFFSVQNPSPWSDATHIQGGSSFLVRPLEKPKVCINNSMGTSLPCLSLSCPSPLFPLLPFPPLPFCSLSFPPFLPLLFKIGSCLTQAGLKLPIFLSLLPKC